MRSPSDDVFRLIKSMSKGEKRNFKLLAGMMSGEKKYIDLFDQIDRQATYDEKKLIRADLYGGQISVAKNYLFRFLMRSLVYHDSTPEAELSRFRDEVRILLAKGLYGQARKILKKSIRQARDLEEFVLLHDLLDQKMNLLPRLQNEKDLPQKLRDTFEDKLKVAGQIREMSDYNYLHQRTNLLVHKRSRAEKDADKEELNDILSHKLLQDDEERGSHSATIAYLSIRRKLCSYQGQMVEAKDFSEQLLKLYTEHPQLRRANLPNFYVELTNYCTYMLHNGEYKKFQDEMLSFKSYASQFSQARLEHFQYYNVLALGYTLHTGHLRSGFQMLEGMEKRLSNYREKIPLPQLLFLYFLLAQLYFFADDLSTTLSYIQKFFAEPRSEYRVDLQGLCRILRLMVYFEQNNFIACESDLQNVQRFLDRNDVYHLYERSVIRSFRYLLQNVGIFTNRELFQKALEIYDREIGQEANAGNRDILYYRLWLMSKIDNRTVAQLRQEISGIMNFVN